MTKPKATKKRNSTMGILVVFIVLFMAELLVYSWCRVQYVQTGYAITEARQAHESLIALQRKLKIEEGRLRSPKFIRQMAEARGLVMPDPRQIIVMP